MTRTKLLLTQMDQVYDRLVRQLGGLTDAEYFWQPVPDCWTVYHEWAFGARRLTFPDLVPPGTAAGAMDRLREGQALLRAALAALDDRDLDRAVPTNWGERWPAWRIFWTMIDHDAAHGAEISCLRDLYRVSRPHQTPE